MSEPTRRSRGRALRMRGRSKAPDRRRPRRKESTNRRTILWFVGASALGICGAMMALFAWSVAPGALSGEAGTSVHFEVTSTRKGEVIDSLTRHGLLSSPLATKTYAYFMTPGASFEPRAHLLTRGISARELVQRLAELGGRPQSKVTFPEGWTHFAMARRLEEAQICSSLGFRRAVHDEELLRELSLTGSAEGFLFPATYQLGVDSDPRDVVRRMVKEARRRFDALKVLHPPPYAAGAAGFGEAEIFNLASIVEKETSIEREAPRVARVFLNRLLRPEGETRGRLQSDPTAAYGCLLDPLGPPSCVEYEKVVTPRMLEDSQNSYNTYRHAGLPPGPISNPGVRAIAAVLRPTEGRELYFVADGKGAHTFSESFAEHQRAIEKLRAEKKRE